jgi:hypothetical protein
MRFKNMSTCDPHALLVAISAALLSSTALDPEYILKQCPVSRNTCQGLISEHLAVNGRAAGVYAVHLDGFELSIDSEGYLKNRH